MVTDSQTYYEEGLAQFREDRLEEAEGSFRKAVHADPSLEDAIEAQGVVLDRLGRLDEAIAVMKRLAELNDNNLMAHVNLSVFYNKKGGMIEEAEEEQAKARILGWKEDLKRHKAGQMAGSSMSVEPPAPPSEEDLSAKRDTFIEVLKIDPEDPLANFSLGRILLQEGQPEKARGHLEVVVRVQKDYSAAYLPLGEALEALDLHKQARETYHAGIAVAGKKGDLKPLQAMEQRLRVLDRPVTVTPKNNDEPYDD